MSASSVALAGALAWHFPRLLPTLREHLEDNEGEVLPHLFMADVIRWLAANIDDEQTCASLLDWLETAYAEGDDEVQAVIAVSGVEMIPDPGEPGSGLRSLLGPHLATVDPWQRAADRPGGDLR